MVGNTRSQQGVLPIRRAHVHLQEAMYPAAHAVKKGDLKISLFIGQPDVRVLTLAYRTVRIRAAF